MTQFTQIVLVSERLFLEYNKTRIMHRVFESLPIRYRIVDISSDSRSSLLRKLKYLVGYCKLFLSLDRSARGQILWLSEFKFSLSHVICAKLIAKLRGMVLVGGPHTLAADRILLTDPAYQRAVFSPWQRFRLCLLNVRDGLMVRALDVVQSYTDLYAERTQRLAGRLNTPKIVFPIGHDLASPAGSWEPTFKQTGELRLVFWGLANALHGLDVLPPALDRLRAIGIRAQVHIFSPANLFIQSLFVEIKKRRLDSHFFLDTETSISNDYTKVLFADVAISHLVSPRMHPSAMALVNALATPNKLFEILALGMPAIAAETEATVSAMGRDACIYSRPGDSDSLAEVLESIYTGRIDLKSVAIGGHHVAQTKYSLTSITNRIAREIVLLGERGDFS